MSIAEFGTLPDGRKVQKISLDGGGLTASILTYGAILQDLRLYGHESSLVLGFDRLESYLRSGAYLGAMVGRCANRVAEGHLEIDGETYQLDRNFLDKHCLHGGRKGLSEHLWSIERRSDNEVILSALLADGEMGFPGNMKVQQRLALLAGGVFDIQIEATCDRPTLCNIAHHSYFCLDDSGDILEHRLQVEADQYLPVDDECIPTGEIALVADGPFDFREARPVGDCSHETGLDHNFCVSIARSGLRKVASLFSAHSQVQMLVHTTEPGLQIYDAAMMDLDDTGLDGKRLGPYAGLALEPQIWPDAHHHSHFPQAMLRPGESYHQHTRFVFSQC